MMKTLARCAVVLASLAVQPGCDRHPTAPTRTTRTDPGPIVAETTALQLAGPDRITPGAAAQLTATAVKSDGSREDVTARTKWSSDHPDVLAVAPDGRVSGRAVGAAVVTGSLEGFLSYSEHAVLVLPAGTFALSGIVRQATYPVAGAKVEVVSAAMGTGMAAVTDAQGHFELFGVAGAVRLRAGKDDYHATFRTFDVSRDRTVEVELEPLDALPVLGGAYLVTFSMTSCREGDLSKELRTRTYRARLTTEGDRIDVHLSGAEFLIVDGHGDRFSIGVLPGEYALDLGTLESHLGNRLWDVLEALEPQRSLGIYGIGRMTGTPARLTGELDGGISQDPDAWDPAPFCVGRIAVSLVRQ